MSHWRRFVSHPPSERLGGSDAARPRPGIKCPDWREIRTVVAGELAGQQTAAGKVNIVKFIFILFFSFYHEYLLSPSNDLSVFCVTASVAWWVLKDYQTVYEIKRPQHSNEVSCNIQCFLEDFFQFQTRDGQPAKFPCNLHSKCFQSRIYLLTIYVVFTTTIYYYCRCIALQGCSKCVMCVC